MLSFRRILTEMVVIGVSSEVLSYCKNKKNNEKKRKKKGFELSTIHGMIRKLKAPLDTYIPYHFTLRFYMRASIICIRVKYDGTELSAALAKSSPLDFSSLKSFLWFFAHEKGLERMFQKSGWLMGFRVLNFGRNCKNSFRVYACCFVNINTVTYFNCVSF